MLIGAIALGLILGLIAGGNIWNLGSVRLRRVPLLLGAVVVRFGTEYAISAGIGAADQLRLPLFALAYGMLLIGLWANRTHPGMSLAFVGILANDLVIVLNNGHMPIWEPSLMAAGLDRDDIRTTFHTILGPELDANFLLHLGPLADIIPIPIPFVRNVASLGDLLLSAGLAFFLFATVVRSPQELDEAEMEAVRRRLAALADGPKPASTVPGFRGETGLGRGLAEAAALDRPLVLGAQGTGLAAPGAAPPYEPPGTGAPAPGIAPTAAATTTASAPAGTAPGAAVPIPIPDLVERARRHPYVRLALNGSFSALWAGQLISLFGDRIHQIALLFLVLHATDSPIALAAIVVASTLPNLVFGPIAGTFVDRWDHREVMVVSDLLRGALVLLVPIAAVTNFILIFPLTFLITTISIFFRPARVAVLPRIVRDDELLTANSALWIGETIADTIGYPLAALFVGLLDDALPLAFWLDAATYIASAAIIWTIVVPPIARRAAEAVSRTGFIEELRQGWQFLRGESTLLANTLQATAAQFTLGILLVLTAVYAEDVLTGTGLDPEVRYGFLETAIGVGNLIGGFAIGLIGARFARGRLVIAGYALAGVCIVGLGVTNQLTMALGLMFGLGLANMVFVIPSQTLFQERTPPELMGRVIGFRFALVFGAMSLAMVVGGVLGEIFGAAPVIGVFGLVTLVAGLAGLLVPAVRDA
jgi:DHA3 family macrolide efflux protein-like MFS transporter